MKKELEELTDEIRKLRKEVRELREAGTWPVIRYVPLPTYVPTHIPFYPQPSIPWWGTITVSPAIGGATTCGPILNNTTTTYLPDNTQFSLT